MIRNKVLNYIPKSSISLVENLINENNLLIKIVKIRKTKHGDFKKFRDGSSQITINHIDNKYRFLITLIHELAHFRVNRNLIRRVKPHGTEWKKTFQLLMLPFLNNTIFPNKILSDLANYLKNPSATTDSNINLVISLSKYDVESSTVFLFDILNETLFQHNKNKIYKKIGKLRKRYICEEIRSKRRYLFSPVTRVEKVNKI
jgi:hypothetical protein|tara:strand:- start:2719 stop:3324 length:606 start_codon:yes stop_codon:yes gene_type:complete